MITESLKRDLEYTYNKLSKEEIERLSNSSVMITGCAGFLGYYFVHFLYAYKEKLNLKKVVCLDNFMLGYPKWLDKISEDERKIKKRVEKNTNEFKKLQTNLKKIQTMFGLPPPRSKKIFCKEGCLCQFTTTQTVEVFNYLFSGTFYFFIVK